MSHRRRHKAPPPTGSACRAETARCEFWTWGENYVRPDCCTEHLLELAVFTHELLEANSVLHWLDFGSLLGAVRDGALIPWDTEVDFGCLGEQLGVVKSLGSYIEAAGHSPDLTDSNAVRINYSATNLLHVDIYPWYERDGRLTTHFDPGVEWPGMSERGPFPPRYLENLETVTLVSHAFPAPSPVDTFLVEHRYGPDYLVPTRQVVGARFLPEIGVEELTPVVRLCWTSLRHESDSSSPSSRGPGVVRPPSYNAGSMLGCCHSPRPETTSRSSNDPSGGRHESGRRHLDRVAGGTRPGTR